MKRKLVCYISFFCLSTFSAALHADERKYEIWFNNIISGNIQTKSVAPPTFGSSTVNLLGGAFVSVGYFVQPGLEIIVSPYINYSSTGQVLTWSGQVGVNYSFIEDILNSVYVQAEVGYGGVTYGFFSGGNVIGVQNTSGLIWSAAVGKRFKLTDAASFAPSLKYMNNASSGSTIGSITFTPVQFSFIF